MTKNIIICDIDGCLNFYPDTFLWWVGSRFGIYKKDINSLRSFLGNDEYEKLKYEYRTCGVKRNLAVRKEAAETFRKIKRLGKKIWLLTTRPTFEPVKSDTEYWLKKNKIIYDKLIFKEKEKKKDYIEKQKEKICCIIDDDADLVNCLAGQLKLTIFLFGNSQNKNKKSARIIHVKSWHDIKILLPKYI